MYISTLNVSTSVPETSPSPYTQTLFYTCMWGREAMVCGWRYQWVGHSWALSSEFLSWQPLHDQMSSHTAQHYNVLYNVCVRGRSWNNVHVHCMYVPLQVGLWAVATLQQWSLNPAWKLSVCVYTSTGKWGYTQEINTLVILNPSNQCTVLCAKCDDIQGAVSVLVDHLQGSKLTRYILPSATEADQMTMQQLT